MSITKLQKLIERTAEEFGVDPRAILSRGGTRAVSTARIVCAFLLKNELTQAEIGSLLGRRAQSYKSNSVKAVYKRSKDNHAYFVTVMKLAEEFGVEWA